MRRMQRLVTIYYDREAGELGTFALSPNFTAENSLLRADVLQDLVGVSINAYNAALEEWGAEMTKVAKKAAKKAKR